MKKRYYIGLSSIVLLILIGCTREREEGLVAKVIEPAHNWGRDCNSCHSEWNLIAMHDASSTRYNPDCIKCHGNMMGETTLSTDIQGIHPRMVRYVVAETGETDITNNTCKHCHRSVNLLDSSAGNIRKQVATDICVSCHAVNGPGKPFYIE